MSFYLDASVIVPNFIRQDSSPAVDRFLSAPSDRLFDLGLWAPDALHLAVSGGATTDSPRSTDGWPPPRKRSASTSHGWAERA